MSELTDDQLDGLFRKSAEEFQTPFDSAAWQDMKSRLDKTDQTAPTGGTSLLKTLLRWGLPVVLVLLLIVGGWLVYRPAKNLPGPATRLVSGTKPRVTSTVRSKQVNKSSVTQQEATERVKSEAMHMPKPTGISDESEPDRKTSTANRNITENRTAETPVPPTVTDDTPDKVSFGKATKSTETVPVADAGRKRVVPSLSAPLSVLTVNGGTTTRRSPVRRPKPAGNSFAGKNKKNSFVTNRAIDFTNDYGLKSRPSAGSGNGTAGSEKLSLSRATGSENDSSAITSKSPFVSLPALKELAIRPAHWPKSMTFTNRIIEVHPDTIASRSVPRTDPMRGLSIRLAVAPDLSGVGIKNFARPGTNVGLLLEYRLASHWSIQAGVIQSTKVYKAATTDYALPDYALKWTVRPDGVDGRCNMIDIPINLRYDLVLKPRQNGQAPSRWFLSGGITSYIMKQEEYTYQYADPTNPHIYPNNRGWSGASGSYGFSELNLSAGYERAISRRLSWQVEPFMKVPLKRVGYLKLNLLSTGAFFSLRYKF